MFAAYLSHLIQQAHTGTSNELARKLGVSRSTLMDHINKLKGSGAPIAYCRVRKSYYYTHKCEGIIVSFKEITHPAAE